MKRANALPADTADDPTTIITSDTTQVPMPQMAHKRSETAMSPPAFGTARPA